MIDKTAILKLETGQRYIVPESDYGKAEVWRVNDVFVLFEIPIYGGKPVYYGCFSVSEIDDMLQRVENWT